MKLSEYLKQFPSKKKVGKGGQKTVYCVERSNMLYALKLISTPDDPRIKQEIDILMSLRIQNVPKICDVGILEDDTTHDSILYILEEFIKGKSLREELVSGPVSLALACKVLETLLSTEIELEKLGILHRDIKPDNIMIDESGNVYIIDFGIAKILGSDSITRTAAMNGPCTPAYAPMELFENMKTVQDVRTDLYQIGLTVYEALTGKNPFTVEIQKKAGVFTRNYTVIPPMVILPGDSKGLLMQYLQMLMSKQQSQRPSTASDAMRYYKAIRQTIIV